MNELRKLNDQALLASTETLVKEERRLTLEVLHHLQEIQRRRAFAGLGYASIFEYCVQHLKYSESAAQRRVQSMRLLGEIPALEQKIEEGKLSLSVIAQAQSFFRQEDKHSDEPMPVAEKIALLSELEGKSSREAERVILSKTDIEILPERHERMRPVTAELTEIRFLADEELLRDFERIKGLLAHSHPDMSLAELMRCMAKKILEKLVPAKKASKSMPIPTPAMNEAAADISTVVAPAESQTSHAAARRQAYAEAEGRCSYVSKTTSRRCSSTYALEIDHVIPQGIGGSDDADNLRLYCRTHNQFAAIGTYGLERMSAHLQH